MSWYYSKNGGQIGPVSEQDFGGKVSRGEIAAGDLVWKEGMADWKPLSQIPEFSSMIPQAMTSGQSMGGGGHVPLPQPPAYSYGQVPPNIPNYLWQSIVVTLLCCMPFGVVAIVFAAKVDGLVARGDIAGANAASKSAKTWVIASFSTGLVITLLYLAAVFFGVISGNL